MSKVFPAYPHQPGMKCAHAFCFDGGTLSIYAQGYGEREGSGYFTFDDDSLDWERDDEGADFRVLKVARSELVALRDNLNEAFPPAPAPGIAAPSGGKTEGLDPQGQEPGPRSGGAP